MKQWYDFNTNVRFFLCFRYLTNWSLSNRLWYYRLYCGCKNTLWQNTKGQHKEISSKTFRTLIKRIFTLQELWTSSTRKKNPKNDSSYRLYWSLGCGPHSSLLQISIQNTVRAFFLSCYWNCNFQNLLIEQYLD